MMLADRSRNPEEDMSEANARTHVTEAVRMLRDNDFDPDDRAMLLATIAQAEATLAVLDRLKEGISLRHAGSPVSRSE
jgi:hypothetical protein